MCSYAAQLRGLDFKYTFLLVELLLAIVPPDIERCGLERVCANVGPNFGRENRLLFHLNCHAHH